MNTVFCYQNCSSDREKLLKFEAEGREFATFLGSLKHFIPTVKGQNAFLTCSWRFLRSNKLEQLEIKLKKKILGFRNMQEELEKEELEKRSITKNCLNDLKNFANSRSSASNFKSFSRSQEQFFLTVGQKIFGNKIPLL